MSEEISLSLVVQTIVDCEHKTAPLAQAGQEFAYSVGTPNIQNGRILFETAKLIDKETYKEWTARAVPQEGDLIFAREAPVGEVGYVTSGIRVCLGQRTVLIRPDAAKVNPRFLHFLLLSPSVQQSIHAKSSGSTVAHLNVQDIRTLSVPRLPDRPHQDQIAAVLGAIDDKIAANGQIGSTSDRLLDAHYTRMSRHAHRTVRLGEIIDLCYGKALKEVDRTPGPIPVFGGNGVSGWHDESLVAGPGIIVGRKGANAGSVSWSQKPFWPIDTAFYVRPRTPGVTFELLFFLLQAARLPGQVGDSAIPGLNRSIALASEVSLLSDEEIIRFTHLARPILNVIDQREHESRVLAELRDTLLPKLISGELRIRDAEKVVEDAI